MKLVLLLLAFSFLLSAKPYKGAELRTIVSYQYGRFEVRMKSAAMSGMLSSFFTYNDGGNLPAQWNEIDIEILGRYNNEVQFNVISQGQINHEIRQVVPYNPHAAFHVYAVEWTPNYISWSVDGYEIYRQTGDHIDNLFYTQKLMMNIWPPNYPDWVGSFNPADLPVYAYYDWVKFYSYTPSSDKMFTLQWTDNFEGFDQSRWQKGTHTWFGNNCDFITQNCVFQDGYMILCLTTDSNTGYSGDPVTDTDVDAPYVAWARLYNGYIDVLFSEALDTASARNTGNFITPGLTVTSAELISERKVRLTIDGQAPGFTYNLITNGIRDLASPANVSSLKTKIVINPLEYPFLVNWGGPAWQDYSEDKVYDSYTEYGREGGQIFSHSQTAQFQNTDQHEIYRNELRDISFLRFRVAEGIYKLTLYFAETEYNAAGQRVFNVAAEGSDLLTNLDIYAESGTFSALEKTFSNISVSDGVLDVHFTGVIGSPVISAVKLEQQATQIEAGAPLPTGFNWQIAPNPFNPQTSIALDLAEQSNVDMEIYSVDGKRVQKIYSGQMNRGKHTFRFTADRLSSGIYFCNLVINNSIFATKKLIYLK